MDFRDMWSSEIYGFLIVKVTEDQEGNCHRRTNVRIRDVFNHQKKKKLHNSWPCCNKSF